MYWEWLAGWLVPCLAWQSIDSCFAKRLAICVDNNRKLCIAKTEITASCFWLIEIDFIWQQCNAIVILQNSMKVQQHFSFLSSVFSFTFFQSYKWPLVQMHTTSDNIFMVQFVTLFHLVPSILFVVLLALKPGSRSFRLAVETLHPMRKQCRELT